MSGQCPTINRRNTMHLESKVPLNIMTVIALSGWLFNACRPTSDKEKTDHRISVEIRNSSGHKLDWIELNWDGPYVPGGVIPHGAFSVALDVRYPQTDSATLDFVDASSRENYELRFSLEEFLKFEPKAVKELTFVITSYTTAEVHVNGKKISDSTPPDPPPTEQPAE